MKRITIVNRSSEIVLCQTTFSQTAVVLSDDPTNPEFTVIPPAFTTTIPVRSFRNGVTLTPQSVTEKSTSVDEKWSISPSGFGVSIPSELGPGSGWKVVKVPDDCPWRMYRCKVSKRCHKLLILPRRELSHFLSDIPDTVPLSSVLLPGTHDTMAFYGWPISQCQSLRTPLAAQLHSGIRVLDIRLAVKSNRLIAYHGIYPQRASFQEILGVIHDFLTARETCRETVVMSIKQEDFNIVPGSRFSQLVHDEMVNGPGGREMFFLDNRVPKLGEVRGKCILFSRFGGDGKGWEGELEGIGIHPSTWPDSKRDGFSWECKDTLVRTHDWYNIPSFLSIPEKTRLATEILVAPPENDDLVTTLDEKKAHSLTDKTLNITFFSAASFPLAFPPTIARGFGWPKLGFGVEGVNARVARWLLDMFAGSAYTSTLEANPMPLHSRITRRDRRSAAIMTHNGEDPRIRGWAFIDFYEDPEDTLVPLLVECNFRGRVEGEEGWYDVGKEVMC